MLKRIEAAAALLKEKERYLLAQRKQNDFYGGLWEFPGGACEEGETFQETIEREINEELGLKIKAGRVVGEFFDQNNCFEVRILLIDCVRQQGVCRAKDCQDFGFFTLLQISKLNLAPADKKIFTYLKKGSK